MTGVDRPGSAPKRTRWWGQLALTYALAAASGMAASAAGLPLAWMLGPFFICGVASLLDAPLRPVPLGREVAQLTIGLGIGLRFTSATLLATIALAPAMITATVYVISYTLVAAFLFRALARTDRTTAFFATAAGGVADMALIAREQGGDASAVGIVHALRVSTTVAIVPLLVVSFGQPGSTPDIAHGSGLELLWLVPALGAAYLTARALSKTSVPNPWLVGSMLVGILLGATGLLVLSVPDLAIIGAQLLLGTWLGCQFRKDVLVALPRIAAAGVAISLFMIVAAFSGALVMAAATSLDLTTSFLALAPAAVTEMVITAKAMQLNPEVVTGFHTLRIFIVCSTAVYVFRLYMRLDTALTGRRER